MAKCHWIYGDGSASKKIADILVDKFQGNLKINQNSEIFQNCFDLVILLTVWQRDTLSFQIQNVIEQTALTNRNSIIIIFQNGNHVNITDVIKYWQPICERKNIKLLYIHSIIESGYFGRFLAPLSVEYCPDSYFIINDDDIMFGSKYYENMIRVVNEGSLCTQNGRVFNWKNNELFYQAHLNVSLGPTIFEHDVQCDFGGHIWTGRMKWLKEVWKFPPLDISNAEDFWISSVLRTKFGIKTMKPMCPLPRRGKFNYNGEYCACDLMTCRDHRAAKYGNSTTKDNQRLLIMKKLSDYLNYTFLKEDSPAAYNDFLYSGKTVDPSYFNMTGKLRNCVGWI